MLCILLLTVEGFVPLEKWGFPIAATNSHTALEAKGCPTETTTQRNLRQFCHITIQIWHSIFYSQRRSNTTHNRGHNLKFGESLYFKQYWEKEYNRWSFVKCFYSKLAAVFCYSFMGFNNIDNYYLTAENVKLWCEAFNAITTLPNCGYLLWVCGIHTGLRPL